jgi:hypothetical protein
MLDPIQYEFRFFQNTLADPEPGAGAETSIFRLQPKVLSPCGSGSTTLQKLHAVIIASWHLRNNLLCYNNCISSSMASLAALAKALLLTTKGLFMNMFAPNTK